MTLDLNKPLQTRDGNPAQAHRWPDGKITVRLVFVWVAVKDGHYGRIAMAREPMLATKREFQAKGYRIIKVDVAKGEVPL